MRYSRIRKSQTKKRYATFILVVLLIFTIIYVAFAGTLGKVVSNFISSFLSEANNDEPLEIGDDEPVLTLPDETQEPATDTSKITDALKANVLTLYTIQMGAFTDGDNALTFAQELKDQGGAGYVINDGFYRVMAVGFQSEEDANKVKRELQTTGIESHIYKLTTAGADMNITATEDNVNSIRSAYEIWEEKYHSLEQIVVNLDTGSISSLEAYDKIKAAKTDLEQKRNSLIELNARQNNNVILTGLVTLFDNSCQSLNKILSKNESEKVEISSEIKYTYIDMLIQYKDYMEQITK